MKIDQLHDAIRKAEPVPKCPDCGGPIRSTVAAECVDKLGRCIDCVNHEEIMVYGVDRLSDTLRYILGVSP